MNYVFPICSPYLRGVRKMATDAVQIEDASEVSAVSESSLIRVLPRESCNVFHNLSNQLCFRGFVLL